MAVWQLKGIHADRETRAMRLIGTAFAVLAAYLLIQLAIVIATGLALVLRSVIRKRATGSWKSTDPEHRPASP
ncbi:hypothetical protein [Arthrobacter sp. 131MFCol6.1]|uniref:hypothetical protein n=1 Tax=Arthrobacter sp. 131MFCol6.1 TaxID=1157944 RepID=UPI0012DC4966|nr:hypothetical protein [Arthrobacter sp. 131MFCol6.1]